MGSASTILSKPNLVIEGRDTSESSRAPWVELNCVSISSSSLTSSLYLPSPNLISDPRKKLRS